MPPLRPTVASTQNDHEGLTSPRGSFFAAPPSGSSHNPTCAPSCPPTSNDFPSGIQIARRRFLSIARVASCPSPPDAAVTKISFSLARSPSLGYQYATCEPSGENNPKPSYFSWPVSFRVSPVSTFRICTVRRSLSPECGSSCLVKVRSFPSGDQEMGEDGELGGRTLGRLQEPEVRRRGFPPSAEMSQMCEGIGAFVWRKSLSPTSNASRCFSISFLFAGSSAVT